MFIEGESDEEFSNELLVSLWIEDSRGRRVPSFKTVQGFAASNNPSIGHFAYVPTVQGTFRTLVSLHLEQGHRLRGFRILAQTERAEQVEVSQVVVQQRGTEAHRVSPERWAEERSQGVRGLVEHTVDRVYQNRTNVVSTLRNVLGEETANRVVARLDQLNRKLRK